MHPPVIDLLNPRLEGPAQLFQARWRAVLELDQQLFLTVRNTRSIFPRPSGRPGRLWISRIPSTAHARSSWPDTNGEPLST